MATAAPVTSAAGPLPYRDLSRKALELRSSVLEMIAEVGTGHPGSSLSCLDLLICLYYRVMRYRPSEPDWPGRDRLILSKGHAAPALYAILIDLGVVDPRQGHALRQLGSQLQGHPDRRFAPVDASAGSLGQGASIAAGLALGLRLQASSARVFVVLGDGESQEGQVWEAAMLAAHYRLDNLCAIVDANGHQHDGRVPDVLGIEPLAAKWASFGWSTEEIDGHDVEAVVAALERPSERGRPRAVVARTVKGHGVDFMEDRTEWHSVADPEELRAHLEACRA